MTLQIRGQLIAGVRASIVRDALRRGDVAPFNYLFIAKECKIPEPKAREVVRLLIRDGYVEAVKPPFTEKRRIQWYALTAQGGKLLNASATTRLDRSKGDKLVSEFVKRVEEVNADPGYLLRVTEVVVYGSYVRGEETLGDVDIACELTRKYADYKQHERLGQERVAAAKAKGRTFTRFIDELVWPEREVKLYLKSRTQGLSIHEMSDFINMAKENTFSYTVLLGSAANIAARLRDSSNRWIAKES